MFIRTQKANYVINVNNVLDFEKSVNNEGDVTRYEITAKCVH